MVDYKTTKDISKIRIKKFMLPKWGQIEHFWIDLTSASDENKKTKETSIVHFRKLYKHKCKGKGVCLKIGATIINFFVKLVQKNIVHSRIFRSLAHSKNPRNIFHSSFLRYKFEKIKYFRSKSTTKNLIALTKILYLL